ncbi:MAG: methionyl-tRNA formyltransferase [Gemmatimonadota bacterium]
MRVVFWGSPAFAVATLDAVLESPHPVVAVVTQPARPQGRGRRPQPTAVARRAAAAGLPALDPVRPRGADVVAALRAHAPDVFVVAAYGAILPSAVLALPPRGALNVHASLLPAYRGAAPVTRALLEGRAETGITIMRMDAGLDTGAIALQAPLAIAPDETAGTLTARLAHVGARLACVALDRLAAGTLPDQPQDDAAASWAPRVTTDAARLVWSESGAALERAARAYDPWPGAWTTWRGERLKVFRLAAGEAVPAAAGPPGRIVGVDPRPVVGVGDGTLALAEVQPAGGRRMAAADWARGRGVEIGDVLGLHG